MTDNKEREEREERRGAERSEQQQRERDRRDCTWYGWREEDIERSAYFRLKRALEKESGVDLDARSIAAMSWLLEGLSSANHSVLLMSRDDGFTIELRNADGVVVIQESTMTQALLTVVEEPSPQKENEPKA
jgi:hypothetical protein